MGDLIIKSSQLISFILMFSAILAAANEVTYSSAADEVTNGSAATPSEVTNASSGYEVTDTVAVPEGTCAATDQAESGLSSSSAIHVGFYNDSCPHAEEIVRKTVEKHVKRHPDLPGGLLRLYFHDCFVTGCDASVLLESSPGGGQVEKNAPGNFGLRGLDVIYEAKSELESECPSTISCADIIAFAARDATDITGGGRYLVPAGRRDSLDSYADDTSDLPSPSADIETLFKKFKAKGFNKTEMVVLSGAHTLGKAHCPTFKNRLYNFTGEAHETQDPSMDKKFAQVLKVMCPKNANLSGIASSLFGFGAREKEVPFDPMSSKKIDVGYYQSLIQGKGLLRTDQELMLNEETKKLVLEFVEDPEKWLGMFRTAMVKLGGLNVMVGDEGEIRRNCKQVNVD